MNRDKKVERLLNEARTSAISEFNGMKATPDRLQALAQCIHSNIMQQANRKAWDFVGVESWGELANLKVECVIVFGKIHVQYDFKKTSVPLLKTWTERGLIVS